MELIRYISFTQQGLNFLKLNWKVRLWHIYIFFIKIVRIDFNTFSTLLIYFSSKVKKTCLVYSKPFIVDILRSVSQHHGIIWPFIRFRAPSFLQISFGHLYTGVNELVLPPIVISYVRLSASMYRFRILEDQLPLLGDA